MIRSVQENGIPVLLGVLGGHESPPIVNDGVMFITTPGNLLYAIEAATGDLLWRYQHNLPENYIAF